jgi:hypothetical protein
MTTPVRDALFAGLILAVICLGGRIYMYRGIHFPSSGFIEAVGMVIAPLPVPLFGDIIKKSLGTGHLPIFDDVEHRVALIVGAAVVLLAIVLAIVTGVMKAFTPRPSGV